MADNCLQYPDIYTKPVGTTEEQEATGVKNAKSELLYKAVRFVLQQSFDRPELTKLGQPPIKPDPAGGKMVAVPVNLIPPEPEAFASAPIPDEVRSRFIAILGMIRADNWEDPRNGKEVASSDDLYHRGTTPQDSFVVDRRFADAVVEAVKDYTRSAPLFNNLYTLMRDEALQGQRT